MTRALLALAAATIACASAPRRGPLSSSGRNAPVPCPRDGDPADCIAANLGHPGDHDAAARALHRACGPRRPDACDLLGHLALAGKGMAASDGAAALLFARACREGLAAGCGDLGLLAAEGRATVGDASPTDLLERGCSGGYAPACHRLGLMALKGPSRDPERALDRFERACRWSRAFGCFEAGALLDAGEGAEKDLRRAFRLYVQACDGGDMRGCNAVGTHLMYGRGVPVDAAGAAGYFERACAARFEDACANLRAARTHPQD